MKIFKVMIAATAIAAAAGLAARAIMHAMEKKKEKQVCTFYEFNEDIESELLPQM